MWPSLRNKLHISFFGATNSGKSTLVNAIAGQSVSLVSDFPGTTTDPVRKRIELPGLGPCVLVDTAGYGDGGELGAERERLTRAVIDYTDVAVLIRSGHPADAQWEALLQAEGAALVPVTRGEDKALVIQRIIASVPREEAPYLTGTLVREGSLVVLVMPQDSEAPQGRIILPQVQVLRELLDRGCLPLCCTPDKLPAALRSLGRLPELVITDSQVFGAVHAALPAQVPLTSFSILLAAAKGDATRFREGAEAIGRLQAGDRVLIAEACTHVPDTEDIGRVKIPALLARKVPDLQIEIAAGNDFPEDLGRYALIIHCGACVASARLVQARLRKASRAQVPMTNYGMALAYLQGILDRVSLP